MKRTKPRRVPKYRHYKPKNLAVVRIDGRDRYLAKYDSPESCEEYHRLLAEWIAGHNHAGEAARNEVITESSQLSVTELIYRYKSHVEKYYVKDGQPTRRRLC